MTTKRKPRGPDVAKNLPLTRVADALLELQACRGDADKLLNFAKSVPLEHNHIASFPIKRLRLGEPFPRNEIDSFDAERMQEFESVIKTTVPNDDPSSAPDNALLSHAYNMVCMAYMVESEVKGREQIAKSLNKVADVIETESTEIEKHTNVSDDAREDIGTLHRKYLRKIVAPTQATLSAAQKLRKVAGQLTGPDGKMPFSRARLLKSLVLALNKSNIQPQHAAVVLSPDTMGEARKNAKDRYKKRRKTVRRAD